LALLADAARAHGDAALAAQADAERAALVERIGPEVRRLAWARDVLTVQGQAKTPNK
jgi:hypothetical protein